MHWELWDTETANLVDTFETEDEALQGVRDLLAVNTPDYAEELSLGAMYDEGEPRDVELPPVLDGDALKARLAEMAQHVAIDASRAVHEQIREWLAEEGWRVRYVEDPQSSFNIMVTLKGGSNVNIFQYRNHTDHLTLSQHCIFDEPSQLEIAQLPLAVQRDAVHRIYRDAAIIGVELTGLATPPNEMTIRTYVYFDGLSKDTLIQRILLTIRALSLSLQTFVQVLEKADSSVAAGDVDRPTEQAVNVETGDSSEGKEPDHPIDQANGAEAGYAVEIEEIDNPTERPSNIVSIRSRAKSAEKDSRRAAG